jgi:hypothetical protein
VSFLKPCQPMPTNRSISAIIPLCTKLFKIV